MPIGGKLQLKGGVPLITKHKKKKKRKGKEGDEVQEGRQGQEEQPEGTASGMVSAVQPTAVSVQSGKTYEDEFAFEIERAKVGKAKSTPWGSGYRAGPEILHGYNQIIKGDTAEERLDLRCSRKSDKFCK